jgi:hypothetical protein
MTAEEIAAVTGLPLTEAVMAGKREFDEPFLFGGDPKMWEELVASIERKGFRSHRGSSITSWGRATKGRPFQSLPACSGGVRRDHDGGARRQPQRPAHAPVC